MKRRQLATAATLPLLFLLIYSACNLITSRRIDVGTLHFEWERHIPVVPLMILPYLSIDLLFVTAPFLIRDPAELRVFVRRNLAAVLIGSACFLILPLKLALPRPELDGWLGWTFDLLHTVDPPHNLFPSLHVVLLVTVGSVYLKRTRGLLRGALLVWFAGVLASTVLTRQHHVPDILGGAVTAIVVFYVFPRPQRRDFLRRAQGAGGPGETPSSQGGGRAWGCGDH